MHAFVFGARVVFQPPLTRTGIMVSRGLVSNHHDERGRETETGGKGGGGLIAAAGQG